MNRLPLSSWRHPDWRAAWARSERWRAAGLTGATLLASLVGAAALLAGCASVPPSAPPHALHTAADAGATGPAEAPVWPASTWWTQWGDTELSALVERALAQQPSLQVAQARLQQAQAAASAAGAARAPQVNGSVDLSRQRLSENGMAPPPLAGSMQWNNSAQLNIAWDTDLFGRHRAELDAAIGQSRAAQADLQAARVALASGTVAGYVDLARLVAARSLEQDALLQRQQVVALVRQRIGAGLDTRVELHQAEGLVSQTEASLQALDEAVARSRHALAELTGQGPQALDRLAPKLADVHATVLPASLPADLLGRRADLVAQRWRVEAATREVELARTEFYPNLNLVAFVGLQSLGLDRFIEAGSRTYGAGPALRLPIFDGGRLRANLQSQRAGLDAAIESYNAALLRALREVADEVSSLQSLERQQRAQSQALQSAEAAFDLAVQRYRAGLGNFLTVLTAEGNVLAQRRGAAELKARHLGAEVALARALGGGYQGDAPEAPASHTASVSASTSIPHEQPHK